MKRISKLDELVYRFQHRWETNPQYRAAVSGVVGLVVILAICSCLGVLSAVTNSVLASAGAGGSGAPTGSLNTGTGQVAPATAFPTYTLPPFKQNPIPAASPIPNSQTPPPGPTATPSPSPAPTKTPCTSNCGGGGGGGGGNGTATVSASPTPWIHGQQGNVSVHTTVPNVGVNIIISFPDGTTGLNNGDGMTDGSGDYTFGYPVPDGATSGSANVVIMVGFNNGANMKTYSINQPCR